MRHAGRLNSRGKGEAMHRWKYVKHHSLKYRMLLTKGWFVVRIDLNNMAVMAKAVEV